MKLTADQQQWLDRIRREWDEQMRPGAVPLARHLFDDPVWLPDDAVQDGRLFASRVAALSYFAKGGVLGEIGTQTGWFARHILDQCQPDALHLFDLEFETLRQASPAIAADPRVTLHQGNSAVTLGEIPDETFDWLYVDGDHSLGGAQRDAEQAVKKIKPEGTLVFNDYTVWSPLEMIDYGVVTVVNALLATRAWRVVYFALQPLMYCDIAIRRR